jgi:hypothetical protein
MSAVALATPLLVSSPIVRAQPVDTTAVVLRADAGDTIDIRDDAVILVADLCDLGHFLTGSAFVRPPRSQK